MNELKVVASISHMFITGHDVAFDDLLNVFEDFICAYDELGTDAGTNGLFLFNNVDVDNVIGVELPGECDMISALR